MKKVLMILMSGILATVVGHHVSAQFSIDAQIRNRLEVRNGYTGLAAEGDVPSVHISQRSRLQFSYNSEQLLLVFTPQDVRIWGDDQYAGFNGFYGNNASLDLFEAYAGLRLNENS